MGASRLGLGALNLRSNEVIRFLICGDHAGHIRQIMADGTIVPNFSGERITLGNDILISAMDEHFSPARSQELAPNLELAGLGQVRVASG